MAYFVWKNIITVGKNKCERLLLIKYMTDK